MSDNPNLFEYTLLLGDNVLILGHRISEWCGHGPILEQDIALTNLALDLMGQARMFLQYAGEVQGLGNDEDQLAFLRDAWDFRNLLIVEQPNSDFAHTIVRQFLFGVYYFNVLKELKSSKDERLAAIAEKSLKEVTYHLKYSSEWMIRLGDGTEESHRRMQTAVDELWMYTGELFLVTEVERQMAENGIGPDLLKLKPVWKSKVKEIMEEATLKIPEIPWMQKGGKTGTHTEHLGYILAELQWMQRAYPGMTW